MHSGETLFNKPINRFLSNNIFETIWYGEGLLVKGWKKQSISNFPLPEIPVIRITKNLGVEDVATLIDFPAYWNVYPLLPHLN